MGYFSTWNKKRDLTIFDGWFLIFSAVKISRNKIFQINNFRVCSNIKSKTLTKEVSAKIFRFFFDDVGLLKVK